MRKAAYPSAADSVLARIEVHPLGCWEYTGPLNHRGYGRVQWRSHGVRKNEGAHRVVFESEVGAIPPGMTLDHLCQNKRCVNPAHLEVVTRGENVRRQIQAGRHPTAGMSRDFCKRGHLMDEANIYRGEGKRRCLACRRLIAREHYHRNRK